MQVLHKLNQLPIYNNFTGRSCEQGLITKKCIATYTNQIFKFKQALYSSALVMKRLTVVEC